jgi:hypothetical protein
MRDWNPAPSALHGEQVAGNEARAAEARVRIEKLKNNLADGRWELAALFSEARAKSWHYDWGFTDFDEYIDKSNFDIGSREVRYHIKINDISLQLGITRDQLKAVAISKLKEIFSLDPNKQAEELKALLEEAVDLSLDQVREVVRGLKGSDPETEMTWLNIQVLRRAKEATINPALAKIKLEHGPTMGDVEGQTAEISDGRALELLCAEKLAEPDATLEELKAAADEEWNEEEDEF